MRCSMSVHRHAVLWDSADDRLAAQPGLCGQSQARRRGCCGRWALEAIYPKPRLSQPAAGHLIYPYLLRGITVKRVNQVWSADITYVRLAGGFVYLVATIDWFSRYVLSWAVSITMDVRSVWRPWSRRSGRASRRSSIPIRGAVHESGLYRAAQEQAAFVSAWMAAGGLWTTCLSSGCGGV